MKVLVVIFIILVFLIVIGVPYKYEKESFLIVNSTIEDIKISIAPTVKEAFLGMAIVHAAPYRISIFCFDEDCLPEIEAITVDTKSSVIDLGGMTSSMTKGGLNTLSQPVMFDYEFVDSDVFTISLRFGDNAVGQKDLNWSILYETSKGFSFLPLWVYFTH